MKKLRQRMAHPPGKVGSYVAILGPVIFSEAVGLKDELKA
jgi:hypothetical protein